MISGPIPGESLTKQPKNAPWERPPEITDPEEAMVMHIARLQNEDSMNSIIDALEFKVVDLYTLVKGIMRSAVSNGIHTIDVGMICAPVVHEYIKQTADTLGIDYDSGIDNEKSKEQATKAAGAIKAKKKLKDLGMQPEGFERDDVEEEVTVEEVTKVTKPMGLASKPQE